VTEAFLLVKKKKGGQEVDEMAEPVAIEEAILDSNLLEKLEEINMYEGVTGYIRRDATSASIDLKDQSKIADLALLSSLSFEASISVSDLFGMGDVKSTLVVGKNSKMLSVTIDQNRLSVFMEKDADTQKVLARLRP
jgi:hypothetical protein